MTSNDAFSKFVEDHWDALYRYAVVLVGEPDAEDLTQSALVKALGSWGRVRNATAPIAYVKRIMVNASISDARKRQRNRETAVAPSPLGSDGGLEVHLVEQAEMLDRLRQLPPRQRAVIVLRYYDDLSEADIARTLGCATGTVKAHASAALKALRVDLVGASVDPTGRRTE